MKKRIDLLLVDMGYFQSREQSRRHIMAGNVFVDNQKVDKAGTAVRIDAEIVVKGKQIPYVSRGGLKLEKAINNFKISLDDKVCMDIGASTGGFTDCMLQNGARKVYSVDVGYGQLAWKLRQDERVVCMERQNIRHLDAEMIAEKPSFASIDVSFISLRLVLPKAHELLGDNGRVVALIKPQFEAGREKVGKKGVVREKSTHIEVIKYVSYIAIKEGFKILNFDFSPIKGPEGNIEYLIYLEKIDNKLDIGKIESLDDFDREKMDKISEFAIENKMLMSWENFNELFYDIEKLVEDSHSLD